MALDSKNFKGDGNGRESGNGREMVVSLSFTRRSNLRACGRSVLRFQCIACLTPLSMRHVNPGLSRLEAWLQSEVLKGQQ
ncbi:unnamed protein product [Sphagnum jensenii]|uniref:Uncharacterized protein n=1 Tax=Sphagnum jensenii TaxID=128206 RepID=A0ABP1ACN2_9BRYO